MKYLKRYIPRKDPETDTWWFRGKEYAQYPRLQFTQYIEQFSDDVKTRLKKEKDELERYI
jgi:hypothetical protein